MKQIFILLSVGLSLLVFSGCAFKVTPINHSKAVYKVYGGPEKTPGEVSTILLVGGWSDRHDYVDWIIVEKTRVDQKKYGQITVLPGNYIIKWGRKFNISPMIKISGTENRSWSTSITFKPGHTYTIHSDRTIGQGYILYSWITDDTLNKTIWGKEFVPGPCYHLRKKHDVQKK